MNPYPFTFKEFPLLKKTSLGKPASKIHFNGYGAIHLLSILQEEREILFKAYPSDGKFFFQRKNLNRSGLKELNETWATAPLPKRISELYVEMNRQMRQVLSQEKQFSMKEELLSHTLYRFETTILYSTFSAVNKAKIEFLDIIKETLKIRFPSVELECEWMNSRKDARTELILHVENSKLQDEDFEREVGEHLKNFQNQLDVLVGKEMLAFRKANSKSDDKIHVFIHDGLLSDDFIRYHEFKNGEKVFEITENGVSIGVQCDGNAPLESYQYFSVYAEVNGKNKKELQQFFMPFSEFSSFDFEACVSALAQYYFKHFKLTWHRLTYVSMKSSKMESFNTEKFNLNFFNEFQDIFDINITTHEITSEEGNSVSFLLVINDEKILDDTNLTIRINKEIKSLINNSFD